MKKNKKSQICICSTLHTGTLVGTTKIKRGDLVQDLPDMQSIGIYSFLLLNKLNIIYFC